MPSPHFSSTQETPPTRPPFASEPTSNYLPHVFALRRQRDPPARWHPNCLQRWGVSNVLMSWYVSGLLIKPISDLHVGTPDNSAFTNGHYTFSPSGKHLSVSCSQRDHPSNRRNTLLFFSLFALGFAFFRRSMMQKKRR